MLIHCIKTLMMGYVMGNNKGRKKFIGRHLMVKGEYVDLILKGIKKTTIRLGMVTPKYKEIIVHGGGRPVAVVKIVNIRHKRIRELTEEDAKKDGFPSVKILLKELRKSYGDIKPDDIVTIIEFNVIKKLTELDIEEPWLGLKPVEIARIALRYCKNIPENDREILEDLTRTESIRKTAVRLFGNINKRWKVRKILRKYLDELIKKNIVKVRNNDT